MNITETLAQVAAHQAIVAGLRDNLEKSIKIRELLDLPMGYGTISVKKVKPFGVTMTDVKNHVARIYFDGQIVREMPLLDFLNQIGN